MPAERFFLDAPFISDQILFLEEQELHHLAVMRISGGDEIELVNGKNQFAIGKVQRIDKRRAEIQVVSLENKPAKKNKLVLAQGIPRFNRLEFILEKGTELGVDEFWLFPGMLSEKETFSVNQHHRMRQLLISAMKQCGRWDLPCIEQRPLLTEWASLEGSAFFGDTRPDAPLFITVLKPLAATYLFIGPEKGFHAQEIFFLEHTLHATGVKLHHNILRTDTAAITALSIASQYL